MKCVKELCELDDFGRTPHGVRGLKLPEAINTALAQAVAPRTGCVD